MNLIDTMRIFAGGPGSGCHGPNCGRPRTNEERERNEVAHGFKQGSTIHQMYSKLTDGEWHDIDKLQKAHPDVDALGRLKIIGKRGIETGLWKLDWSPDGVVRMIQPDDHPITEETFTEYKSIGEAIKNAVAASSDKGVMPYHEIAFQRLEQYGMDKRLAQLAPLQKIIHETSTKGYAGQYDEHFNNDKGGVIKMLQSSNQIKMAETFIHEFGHHLDYQFVRSTDGTGHKAHEAIDQKKVDERVAAMNKEYTAASLKAAKESGSVQKGKNAGLFNYFGNTKFFETDAPSLYAMKDRREWFAEATKYYFKNDECRQRLKEKTPGTYKLIDDLMQGRLFK